MVEDGAVVTRMDDRWRKDAMKHCMYRSVSIRERRAVDGKETAVYNENRQSANGKRKEKKEENRW